MNPIRLSPVAINGLILVAGAAWNGNELIRWRPGRNRPSLYQHLSKDRHSKAIMDLIMAIHGGDKVTIKRHKRWCEVAMSLITDSITRRSWVGNEEGYRVEMARLKPLRKLVAPYLHHQS